MIGVLDATTEGIAKVHVESYIHGVFFDVIAQRDAMTRLRLAEQLVHKVGPYLFPGEELTHPFILGANLEALYRNYVMAIHALRRQWRH